MRAIFCVAVCAAIFNVHSAHGLQVFLTNLTVFTKHRLNFEGALRVYFQCDGNDRVNLPDVTVEGHPYSWPQEDLLLTTVTRGSCKTCGFREDRLIPFVQDDQIGADFPLCEADFNGADAKDNMVRWFADTQFDAVLFCGDCRVPAPPPPPVALAPAQVLASAAVVEGGLQSVAGDRRWWQSVGAIVGMSVSAAIVLGFATGLVAFSWYGKRQQQRKEERAREFEAVFSDPDLDLEEVAAQDVRSLRSGGFAFFKQPWARLRDTQMSSEGL